MNFIKGYKATPYNDLQKELYRLYEVSGKTMLELAADANVTTTNTIHSAINSESQVVSDKVLTRVFESLGFSAFILWINGEKHYFIKSKN